MSNLVDLPPNNKSGLYKAPLHTEGGVQVIVDGVKKIEVEGDEYHLEKRVLYNNKEYAFKNKTNLEILDYIFKDNKSVFVQGQANSSDYIICRLAVLDKTRHDFYGTAKDFVNLIQGEHGCKTTGNNDYTYEHRLGGEISNEKYFIKNEIDKHFNISGKYKEKGIGFIKGVRQMYTDGIYAGKNVLKPVQKDAERLYYALNNGEISKIKEIRDKYYPEWNKSHSLAGTQRDRFVRIDTSKVELYNTANAVLIYIDKLRNQIKDGSKVELEHIDTLEKVSKGELSPKEGAVQISKDHIAEDPAYYEKLEEVENPFGRFIEIVKSSKDFDDAFSKVKKIKDVPSFVADEFSAKYNPEGKLSMEKAFKVFYDEYKSDEAVSQKQELQDLIDLFKEAVKENPNDQESKDLLELYEENLKEFNPKKTEKISIEKEHHHDIIDIEGRKFNGHYILADDKRVGAIDWRFVGANQEIILLERIEIYPKYRGNDYAKKAIDVLFKEDKLANGIIVDAVKSSIPAWVKIGFIKEGYVAEKGLMRYEMTKDEFYKKNPELIDKFSLGGSINRKLTYLGEVGGDKIGQKSSLEKAKSLEKQGISNEEIHQETGWFLNPYDKKWRFEISDEDFEIIYDFEDAKKYFNENKDKTFFKKKLSDVIGHDKLFLAYPEFKNVTFYFFNQKNAKLAGVFIPENKEKEIFIIYNIYDEKSRIEQARGVKSTKSTNETWVSHILRISDVISGGSGLNYRPISNDVYKFRRNIIAHELQHLIQIREEFGAGSSPKWWYEEIIRKRGIDESKLSEIERNNLRIESKLYSKNSSGEIEARDIDLRLDFNDKERKGIIPLSLVIVNPDYVTIDIEENRFKQGGELNAEESILNAPCINKKFKFVESSDFNEYRKGGIISGLKGLFNSKDDDIDYEGIRDSVSDTIKKIAEKHNGTVNYILDKKDGSTSLDFNFPTPEDKYNFTQELNKFNNETLRLEKGGSINNMTKEELKAFYNTKEGKELDKQTYNKWKKIVNMSKSELEKFYNSEEGKEAGLSASEAKEKGIDSGRESARWIMKMKDVPYTEWTPEMWRWAKKQISFISRMSGMKGDLYDENGNKTKKLTSLLIWGHNPEKYEDGGEIKNINSLKELLSLEKEEAIKIIEGVLRSDSFYSESKKGSFYEMAKSSYVVCNDLLKFNKKNPIKTKMGDLAYFEPDYRLIARDGYFVAQIKYAAHQVTHLMNGKRVFDSSKNEDYSILMECLLNPDDRAVDSMDENKVYYHKVISTKQSGILVFEAVIDKLGVIKHITIMPNKTASHWNNYVTGNNQKGEIRYSLASPLVSPLSKSASEDEINTEETPLKTTDFVNVGNGSTNIQIKNDNMQEKNEKFSQGGEIEDVIVLLEPYEKDDEDFKRSMEFFKIMNQARINLELIKGDKSNSYTNDEFQTEVDRLILEKDNNYMKGTLFAGGGKIEVNKVSVYQTAFYGLSFADLGGYFESKFTDVIDLEDENVILKDAPIFLFFKNPYDTRYSSKISIDDVIGAIMPKKMEKDARNIFDKRFISYVTYSDDSTNEHKIEAIKKLADINEDIILK